jgi:hypothetical protein
MHDVSDPRNASILINVNGELKPRAEAVVSVFDSGFGSIRARRRFSTDTSTGCSRARRRSPWTSA